jgi:hypothetical protein
MQLTRLGRVAPLERKQYSYGSSFILYIDISNHDTAHNEAMYRSYIIPCIQHWKLTVAQMVKKLVDPCSLDLGTEVHPEPNTLIPQFNAFPPKIRFNIILQLRLYISSDSFPSCFSTNCLHKFYLQCPTHLPFFDFITVIKLRTRDQVTRQLRHPRLDASAMA